jgi:hypothetical protein
MRIAPTLVLLAACGGGHSSLTALEGVYTINTWTQNSASCDAEGASILGSDTFLYIKTESLLGTRFVNVNPCPSVGECTTEANDKTTINLGNWGFDKGSDSAGWTSDSSFGFDNNGNCDATRDASTMTDLGGAIKIEQRSFDATYPGACNDAMNASATASAPCGSLQVLMATFEGDF